MITLDSLLDAWDEFKTGKTIKDDVQKFEFYLEDNLFKLYEDLINKSYAHTPYEKFYIRDPKIRPIHKSSVRDRIVHHAVFKILNAVFDPTFIFDSYSCRVDKGTHRAVLRLKKFADSIYGEYGKCFILKCDIKKFFHSIDHEILLKLVSQKLKNENLLQLIKILIDSFPENLVRERERVKGALLVI